jgi:hypothetical protein
MKKQIRICDKKIEYTLKVSRRAKRIRLAIYCDASFVVTAPFAMPYNIIEKFIVKKSKWVIGKIDFFKKINKLNKKKRVRIIGDRADFLKYKNQAQEFVKEKINRFNKFYNFSFNRINIKNQKTRWGSCSKKGNLNFNYKIIFLKNNVADYLIVHELCHLAEFNHSYRFWNLVAKTIPDYLKNNKDLKDNYLLS